MAKIIEINTNPNHGLLNINQTVYPNQKGKYSPIVLEIEQIRERGLWANDPLITTQDENKKEKYESFFNKFYQIPLLKNFRLFEKRLYRWGWCGLVIRFYGDKNQYTLNFETRKVQSVNINNDTNEMISVQTIWYFVNDGWEYKVLENWDKTQVTRQILEEKTTLKWSADEWTLTHPERPIYNWVHNYGIIPVLPVINSMGENGEVINGFANALTHINSLDRLDEEIKYETIATRSKTYFDVKAFQKLEMIDNKPVKTQISENTIINSTVIGIDTSELGMVSGGDSLNDNLKAKVPIYVAQFNRTTLTPLFDEKDKLYTQIYTMLGFTNPNTTSVIQKTATEMEYYNENTAATLKNLSLDRTNTLHDFIDLILKIGISQSYSDFTSDMTIDDLKIKVIPNIKTDETLFLDYHLKKYDNNLLTLAELKEIIDNTDKEAVESWMKENGKTLVSINDATKINQLSSNQLIDKATLLNILFHGVVDESEIQKIITQSENEAPESPMDDLGFGAENDTNFSQSKQSVE